MSEIEKMYMLAKVKNKYCCKSSQCIVTNPYPEWCNKCESLIIKYPDFTAEKQLSLIKWLGELDMLEIMRTTRDDKAWIINSEYGMSGNVYEHTSRMKSFEEALAGLINSLWQELTDQERTEIAEILKG